MKKRCVGFLLAVMLLAGLLPVAPANAASLSATPYLNITYGASDTVSAGSIRYVSQLSASPNFHDSYWGNYVDAAGWECYTAAISMALSSIGSNATPGKLGDYWNGKGYEGGDPFATMAWDVEDFGATYLERTFFTAVENFLNHPGVYSPPIIHLTTYSERGHYVLVAGRISGSTYLVVDPANDGTWPITIENNVASYTRYDELRSEELEKTTQYYRSGSSLSGTPSASTASAGYHQDGSVCASAAMTDVPAENSWAHSGIDYCIQHGLMQGVSASQFKPSDVMTRAMLVTVLYRAAGRPDVSSYTNPFSDMSAGWYYDAVTWAYHAGVTSGVSAARFAPDSTLTREQLVSMLYRFRQLVGATPARMDALDGFYDAVSVSSWAAESMRWAVTNGILSGISSTSLSPSGAATRAQLASILLRYMSL